MNWDALDFVIFFGLLLAVGVSYVLAARKSQNRKYRFAAGIALLAAFLLFWINGAVGIIGNANNDANMMYLGVLGTALGGAVIARFNARGMARALIATAIAQALVAVIAVAGDLGSADPLWPRDVLALTAFFALLWLASAWLFNSAARNAADSLRLPGNR